MADLKLDRKLSYYKCGKCGGMIGYNPEPPELCPECGYSRRVHGLRRVNDIPQTIKVDLTDLTHT